MEIGSTLGNHLELMYEAGLAPPYLLKAAFRGFFFWKMRPNILPLSISPITTHLAFRRPGFVFIEHEFPELLS